jgi:hypothetical protein
MANSWLSNASLSNTRGESFPFHMKYAGLYETILGEEDDEAPLFVAAGPRFHQWGWLKPSIRTDDGGSISGAISSGKRRTGDDWHAGS